MKQKRQSRNFTTADRVFELEPAVRAESSRTCRPPAQPDESRPRFIETCVALIQSLLLIENLISHMAGLTELISPLHPAEGKDYLKDYEKVYGLTKYLQSWVNAPLARSQVARRQKKSYGYFSSEFKNIFK